MKKVLTSVVVALYIHTGFLSAQIPNHDFENWTAYPDWSVRLDDWVSFYSELLAPMTFPDTDSYSGIYSMHMSNNFLPSYAYASFSIDKKPKALKAWGKGNVNPGDSIYIKVVLFNQSLAIDSGKWVGFAGFDEFTAVTAEISSYHDQADSAYIYISGGTADNTDLKVDQLSFDFESYVPAEPNMKHLLAYPSPFTDEVKIAVEINVPVHCELKLTAVSGKVVEAIAVEFLHAGLNEISLNTSSLSAGIYLCSLASEGFYASVPVVKMK